MVKPFFERRLLFFFAKVALVSPLLVLRVLKSDADHFCPRFTGRHVAYSSLAA